MEDNSMVDISINSILGIDTTPVITQQNVINYFSNENLLESSVSSSNLSPTIINSSFLDTTVLSGSGGGETIIIEVPRKIYYNFRGWNTLLSQYEFWQSTNNNQVNPSGNSLIDIQISSKHLE